MTPSINRRTFSLAVASLAAPGSYALATQQQTAPSPQQQKGPVEEPFERDYDPPSFRPSWSKRQINRQMLQDFVIYGHSDLEMVKKLLEKQPMLINGMIDWGAGDWETALGGASHMGRHDIVEFLLEKGARIDLFCAAMMGQIDAIKSFLTLQPNLIDCRGPHGFSLHFHAQVGGDRSKDVLDYLQSIKEVKLRPIPFLNRDKK